MQLRTVSEDGGMRMGLIVEGKRIPVMKFNVEPKTPPRQAGAPVAARTPIRITTVRGRTQVGRPNRFLARMAARSHWGVQTHWRVEEPTYHGGAWRGYPRATADQGYGNPSSVGLRKSSSKPSIVIFKLPSRNPHHEQPTRSH